MPIIFDDMGNEMYDDGGMSFDTSVNYDNKFYLTDGTFSNPNYTDYIDYTDYGYDYGNTSNYYDSTPVNNDSSSYYTPGYDPVTNESSYYGGGVNTYIDNLGDSYLNDSNLQATKIENNAKEGQSGYGWQYFSDGTAISPDGKYYYQGKLAYDPSKGAGASIDTAAILSKVGDKALDKLKSMFTKKNADGTESTDWRRIVGAAGGALAATGALNNLGGGSGGNSPPPSGYQGGIPKYTAVRSVVPMIGEQPKAGDPGRRYFSDQIYATDENKAKAQTDAYNQAQGLAALQKLEAKPLPTNAPPTTPAVVDTNQAATKDTPSTPLTTTPTTGGITTLPRRGLFGNYGSRFGAGPTSMPTNTQAASEPSEFGSNGMFSGPNVGRGGFFSGRFGPSSTPAPAAQAASSDPMSDPDFAQRVLAAATARGGYAPDLSDRLGRYGRMGTGTSPAPSPEGETIRLDPREKNNFGATPVIGMPIIPPYGNGEDFFGFRAYASPYEPNFTPSSSPYEPNNVPPTGTSTGATSGIANLITRLDRQGNETAPSVIENRSGIFSGSGTAIPNQPPPEGPITAEQLLAALSGTGAGMFRFAEGGLANLNVKNGMYLGGPTDGMADKLPATIDGNQEAALSHGEFVIPADVVGHLGNGNSEAGAQRLYGMMDKIRMARTGTTEQGKKINPDKFLPS